MINLYYSHNLIGVFKVSPRRYERLLARYTTCVGYNSVSIDSIMLLAVYALCSEDPFGPNCATIFASHCYRR